MTDREIIQGLIVPDRVTEELFSSSAGLCSAVSYKLFLIMR